MALGISALASTLASCSGGRCDFHSHGACVEFQYDFSALPDVQRRLDRVIAMEMKFWGLHDLDGWRIQYRTTTEYDCYLSRNNEGCTNFFAHEMSVHVPLDSRDCFEGAELLHELGHYTIGDPTHTDPRWRVVDDQFAGIVWDRPDAPEACILRYAGITNGVWPVHIDGF